MDVGKMENKENMNGNKNEKTGLVLEFRVRDFWTTWRR